MPKNNSYEKRNRDRRRSRSESQRSNREKLTLRQCKPGLIVWHLPSRVLGRIVRTHYGMAIVDNGMGIEFEIHPRKLAIAYPSDAHTDRIERLADQLDYEDRVKRAKRECRDLYHFDPSNPRKHGRPVTWEECLMVPFHF
jgi:hypothetical protein